MKSLSGLSTNLSGYERTDEYYYYISDSKFQEAYFRVLTARGSLAADTMILHPVPAFTGLKQLLHENNTRTLPL